MRTWWAVAGTWAIVVLIGCSSAPPRPAGFLGDTSVLAPVPGQPDRLYYERPGADWKSYTSVMLDPVQVCLLPEARERELRREDVSRMTDYFRAKAVEAVQSGYPVVNAPGPGVLRIRAAITDLVPTNVAQNLLTTAAVGLAVDMGGASMEAEFVDSVTGERLAAVVDRKTGSPLALVENFTTWDHARAAFDEWAQELRKALDEARTQ